MEILDILRKSLDVHAADVFIVAGKCLSHGTASDIQPLNDIVLKPSDTIKLIKEIYMLAENRSMEKLENTGDDDFSFAIPGLSRFRVSAYKQRNSYAAVVRVIVFELPEPHQLNIPQGILDLTTIKKGMVLVTGSAGSGKSTTLACMVDYTNKNENYHIITIEDPVEFLHRHNSSIVSQREIGTDVSSYLMGLRAALRQRPNVILLGELRDQETISAATTAAETGHLILSTLHTIGAANTIERILDAFPASQQHQISVQIAMVLQAVVSQQLLPGVDGKMYPAFEIMKVNPAIRTLIRENKIHQIENVIFSAQSEGMITMDMSIYSLFSAGKISQKTALDYASNSQWMTKKIQLSS